MEKSTAHKFDKIAKIYDTPVFQLFYFWAHKSCIKFLRDYIKNYFKVLDVACGTGIFLEKLSKQYKGLELFGIDNSEKMISVARRRSDLINFKIADAEKIPFEDSSFDLITIIDAIYYFQDKEALLKECSRLLKTNHRLFIFYPAIDLLPKFILKQIQFTSRLFFYNSEEYSIFPKVKELKKMADMFNFKIDANKIKMMHRFIIFTKK